MVQFHHQSVPYFPSFFVGCSYRHWLRWAGGILVLIFEVACDPHVQFAGVIGAQQWVKAPECKLRLQDFKGCLRGLEVGGEGGGKAGRGSWRRAKKGPRLEMQFTCFYVVLFAFALLQNKVLQFWRPYQLCPWKASLLLPGALCFWGLLFFPFSAKGVRRFITGNDEEQLAFFA